jgi:pimeloyl-ACP methyl ester carboxylesterase
VGSLLANLVDLPGEGTPICVVRGYGGGPGGYGRLQQALNAGGNRVISVGSLRKGGAYDPKHAQYGALALQAEHIAATLAKLDVQQVILLGHSMGGPVATIVASIMPQIVRRIVYVCSACIYADSPWSLGWRMAGKIRGDVARAKKLTGEDHSHWPITRAEAIAYARANLPRAVQEGWTLGRFRTMLDMLRPLGIEPFFIAGEQDGLFDAERQRRIVQTAFGDQRFATIDCGHDPQLTQQGIARLMQVLQERALLT